MSGILRYGLFTAVMITLLIFSGCAENDHDEDPPRLTATVELSGTASYATNDLSAVITISGQIEAGYGDLEFESDTATVTFGGVSGGAPLLDWTAAVTNLQPGSNIIVVSASDQIGNRTQVYLNILVDQTPPTVSVYQILTPTSLLSQVIGGSVEDSATLTVDGTPVPVDQSLWEYPVSGPSATYNIVAIDPAGNYNSLLVPITVDPAVPGLSIHPPARMNATYNSLILSGTRGGVAATDILLVFNRPLTPTAVINSATVADGWEVTLTDIPAGMTLATATLYNSAPAYNSATVPVATTRIYFDISGPALTAFSPAANSVTASPAATVTFRFNESIQLLDNNGLLVDPATGLGNLFALTADTGAVVSGTLTYDDLTRTATFAPDSDLMPGAIYHAVLLKDDVNYRIVDLAGNTINDATLTDWTFTTAAQ
ncbi:MAG: Ig-like domain-containing protein [Desulfuromonadales bacterium]|nr:Ig-like domain-containing protein [Desulfuromonadales bacterium]